MRKNVNLKVLSGVFLVTFLLILFVPPSPQKSTTITAEGIEHYSPWVELILLKDEQTVYINSFNSSEVVFIGQVTAKFQESFILAGSTLNVTLTSEDPWGTSILEPKHLIFTEDGNQTFQVRVNVSILSKYNFENGELNIFGTWFLNPQGLDGYAYPQKGLVGVINFGKFSNFSLSYSDKKNQVLKPGDRSAYEFWIKNCGNVRDTFEIRITNLEKLSKNGITAIIATDIVDINPNDEKTLLVIVGVNDRAETIGSHEIVIEVFLRNNKGELLLSQNITFELNIPGQYFYHTEEFRNSVYVLIFIIVSIIIVKIVKKRKKNKKKKNNKKKI